MILPEFIPDPDPEAVRCCQAVIQARWAGVVRCGISRLQPPLDGFSSGLQAVFSGDVTALLGAFAAEHRLEPLGSGWNSATDSTFDTGVVMLTRLVIGLIWAEEED